MIYEVCWKIKKNDLTDLLLGHKNPFKQTLWRHKKCSLQLLRGFEVNKSGNPAFRTLCLSEGTIAENSAFSTKAHLIRNVLDGTFCEMRIYMVLDYTTIFHWCNY